MSEADTDMNGTENRIAVISPPSGLAYLGVV